MFKSSRLSARKARFLNAWHARRATRKRVNTAGFVSSPEPRTIGSFARGRQLTGGNFLFAGSLIAAPHTSMWDLTPPNSAFDKALHGFGWMDDLAAVGDAAARTVAQDWVLGWIDSFGTGRGIGWTPDLTGRRLIRWINHAIFVLRGATPEQSEAFFRAIAQQTLFLSRRWHAAAPGLPRFEALTGLIYAGLSIEGQEKMADPAIAALARECSDQINDQGGLPTRNPEELLSVFTLLTWAAATLAENGRTPAPDHMAAIERIAPTLRNLRHADGGLARFHGGGRGTEGWLDHALAAADIKPVQTDGLSMGYARLSAGRTSVIVDADMPPSGKASGNAHASTLAFELTSGRRPLIVNSGSGANFGLEWRRAGRATPSHSVLSLGRFSSARLSPPDKHTGAEWLTQGPEEVKTERSATQNGWRFQGGHNGYAPSHGLTHARTLDLSADGRSLKGEDLLVAIDKPDQILFDKMLDATNLEGVPFDVRFHLHPDVDATLDLGGAAVSMALKSGEIWVFRHDGAFELSLDPGVYLEATRLKPRATRQIVLKGRALSSAVRVRWSLSKAQETAIGVRDLARDDPMQDDY